MDFENARQRASELEYEYLEKVFTPIVKEKFIKLVQWIPKRRIKLIFGMGTYVLDVEMKSSFSYTPFWDSYGNMNDYHSIINNIKDCYQDNPLVELIRVLDECHDSRGHCLCLDDLSYTPL